MKEAKRNRPLRVVAAPDSFKGCLTSEEAGEAVRRGVLARDPGAVVKVLPVGDGGEGTARAVMSAKNAGVRRITVPDTHGFPTDAEFGWIAGEAGPVAVFDMAAASGIRFAESHGLDYGKSSTAGVGRMIREALALGAAEIVVGLGGSGTGDGGIGALTALGARFFGNDGALLSDPKTEDLGRAVSADLTPVRELLRGTKLTLLYDSDVPLNGERGAVRMYSRQKGALEEDIPRFAADMERYAEVCDRAAGEPLSRAAGAGAAGGLGYGLSLVGGILTPGAAYVLGIVGLEEAARDADLVVTGEGKTDVQTATGKLPLAVAMAAKRVNPGVKTVCLCAVDESTRELYERGTDAVFALADRPMTAEESMRRAAELIEKAAYNMTGLL